MTKVFDGKAYAEKRLRLLSERINRLSRSGIKPKLVSILVGNDPASVLYVNLKKKAAERIGGNVDVLRLPKTVAMNRFIAVVVEANNDKNVHGIMVQLPLPENFSKEDRDKVLHTIAKEKDVDGLRENSPFLTPTVKAVLDVLREGMKYLPSLRGNPYKVLVVGSTGFEGNKIIKALKNEDYDVEGANSKTKNLKLKIKNSDVVISATGVPNLIKKDMVNKGSILIDVGSPKGDIEKDAYKKASFVSPVPGGVGPVTISCLLENLIESSLRV